MGDDGGGRARHRRPEGGAGVLTPPTGLPAVERQPPVVRPPVVPVVDPCVCAHPREAHEHWRHGSDCGVCGRAGCARFRRPTALRRLLRRLS